MKSNIKCRFVVVSIDNIDVIFSIFALHACVCNFYIFILNYKKSEFGKYGLKLLNKK